MDTRFIEVAIGLVLVFALCSLLVSALQELCATAIGLRGKVLHQAIVSFVGDDLRFAQALLDHPLLVSLAQGTQDQRAARRPSYVNADSVVAALLGHLVDTHAGGQRPPSPRAFVDLVLQRLHGAAMPPPDLPGAVLAGAAPALPNALFVRGMAALVQGVEQDWTAFEARLAAWYDAVGERSTGWFKRKTQVGVLLLGLLVAGIGNINPIVIGARLWEDGPTRAAVVRIAEQVNAPPSAAPADSGLSRLSQACRSTAGAPSADVRELCAALDDMAMLGHAGLPIGWSKAALPAGFTPPATAGLLDWLMVPLGWALVALACTLGAPFWFDALGRLVRLRGSGGRTDAAPATAGAAAGAGGKGLLTPATSARAGGAAAVSAAAGKPDPDESLCGCDVDIAHPTADAQLPAARGGVA